jgi:hypothetical protein
MCLNESYSWVQVGKNLSDVFLIMNGILHVDNLLPLLFNFALEYTNRKVKVD